MINCHEMSFCLLPLIDATVVKDLALGAISNKTKLLALFYCWFFEFLRQVNMILAASNNSKLQKIPCSH